MAQADYNIANLSGAAFRTELNETLSAILSLNSGSTAPANAVPYSLWADTSGSPAVLKQYNGSSWVTIGNMGSVNLGLAALASPTFTGVPLAPTASAGTNTTQIATTAFVVSSYLPLTGGTVTGNVTLNAQSDIRFADADSSNYIAIQAPATITANVTLTLPAADGTNGQVLSTNGSGTLSWVPRDTRNGIINGDFSVAQRGTSFTSTGGANNDDTYTLDRWYILSDGNDVIDVTQETSTVPTNQKYAIALDVETINKKFGIAQIIESANCVGLTGGNATISFKAKVSSTTKLDNVKAAIVAWSGTADTITSDIISAWGAEGTNPTLIANATYENTPANLSVTTSYATYSLTANIDTASTKNIIVFIWSDVTDTTLGDFLYITDVQLETGAVATSFDRRSYGQELALCQRYYEVINYLPVGITYAPNGDTRHFTSFTTTKRVVPTMGGFPHTISIIANTYLGEGVNLNGTLESASSTVLGFHANNMGNSVNIGAAAGGGEIISWGDNSFRTVTASAEL